MKTACISNAIRFSRRHSDDHDHPVIKIITDLPDGVNNAFYLETIDSNKQPVFIQWEDQAKGLPSGTCLNAGDSITFDKKDGMFKTCVLWNNRVFRQSGYSFDESKI